MKKFIAGVVLTVVAFMALTTGALAGRSSSGSRSDDPDNSVSDDDYNAAPAPVA